METPLLAVASRILVGKKVQELRRKQIIPAVVYGHGIPSATVQIERLAFQKVWRQAGSSSLVDLVVDQQPPVKVLIQDVDHHPTKNVINHVDFYRVKMTEKLETDIELNFIGESAAVKEQGGVLIRSLDKVKVECLPGDLVHSIDVDISGLKNFEDRIHVSDIVVPKGITIMDKADEVVASVTPPRSESELEALSGKVEEDVTTVSGVEKVEKPAAAGEVAEEAAAEEPSPKAKKEA